MNYQTKRMNNVFQKFEIHAAHMINRRDLYRKGKLIKENVWKYYNSSDIFRFINELFKTLSPYIDNVIFFRLDKQSFIEYCEINGIEANDDISYEYMVKCIISEYSKLLNSTNSRWVIVPDKLDSNIRDLFIKYMSENNNAQYWGEPIQVESYDNAFA